MLLLLPPGGGRRYHGTKCHHNQNMGIIYKNLASVLLIELLHPHDTQMVCKTHVFRGLGYSEVLAQAFAMLVS